MLQSIKPRRAPRRRDDEGLKIDVKLPKTNHGWRLAAVLLLLTAAIATGCGGVSANKQPVNVAAGAATIPQDSLTAADIPLDPGTEIDFIVNTPGRQASVNFSLDGPWNFNASAEDTLLKTSIVAKSDVPLTENFPEAKVALKSVWSSSIDKAEYDFMAGDNAAWRNFGKTGADGNPLVYSTSVKALIFPAPVEKAWTEFYSESFQGQIAKMTVENKIVSKNRLTVPAGTYDAYLLQRKITLNADQLSAFWPTFVTGLSSPEATGGEQTATVATPASDDQYSTTSNTGGQPGTTDMGGMPGMTNTGGQQGSGSASQGEYGINSASRGEYGMNSAAQSGYGLNSSSSSQTVTASNAATQPTVTIPAGSGTLVVWDYIWIVPGIGRAAEIISLPNEADDVFDSASAFYRLKRYEAP